MEGAAWHFDRLYSYALPQGIAEDARAGMRVLVPFGRGNGARQGVIWGFGKDEPEQKLKQVLCIIDGEPLLDAGMLALAGWVRERTFCTYFEAARLMMPAGLNLRVNRRYSLAAGVGPDEIGALEGAEQLVARALLEHGEMDGEAIARAVPEGGAEAAASLKAKKILVEKSEARPLKAEATENLLRLAVSPEDAAEKISGPGLTAKQKKALNTVMELGGATLKEVLYYSGVSRQVITGLMKKGLVEQFERRVFRTPYKNREERCETPPLSESQQEVYLGLRKKLFQKSGSASLLFGVTGSGKTLVFMKLIEDVMARGGGTILLVPEISLTPQMVSRFYSRFGDAVAVLHSGLSVGERLDEWDRIRSGAAKIVVGTRSAVFAPVLNLALVIVDEEQEYTYKSESSPRFHARDIARYRCAASHALLLLSSATPSVETFFAAKSGRYGLFELKERFGSAELPRVFLVDMKKELAEGNTSPLSNFLLGEIKKNMENRQQTILMINRRGYNTYVSCADCGHVLTCPNCSIALTYHRANGRLMCHACGYSTEVFRVCPACGSGHLRYSGSGTQKIEQEIENLLPEARVLRMDMDTTVSKFSHEKILSLFARENYDILLGTQMVAKGLDFPNVTLVGVLSADQSLYMNDFRASERTFSLLTQVVGRSGRGSRSGRAVIQTQTPENPVLALAGAQDYESFYRNEIRMRRMLLYPPFCDLCEIGFSALSEADASAAAGCFFSLLEDAKGASGLPLKLLGPMPAGILRVNNRYRYKVILKCRNNRKFRAFLSERLMQYYGLKISRKAAAFVDINPLGIL